MVSLMTRIPWQETIKRFTHIDAEFVRCEIGLPSHDGFYTVALYPWWEHPQYLEAREEGKKWGFKETSGGFREVTVYPKGVIKFQVSRVAPYQLTDIVNWDFTREHPLLWQYQRQGAISCHSPLTVSRWMEIATLAQNKLTGYNRAEDVSEYANRQVYRFGHTASFSLGTFPKTLYDVLRQVLDEQEICYFTPNELAATDPLVLFLIDGDDYIIADDFEVDVPEFVHDPEWFQPS